jgi:putative nucleotide binding protein
MDFLPTGRSSPDKSRYVAAPTAQVLGEDYFTMLEAELKPGTVVEPSERIYVGKERREKVNRILGRIGYQELTASAKAELPVVLEKMIENQEQRFVKFFNNAQAVTPRMHALEILPGIGKKSMWQIIDQRDRKPFENFADIQKRTSISDPVKTIAKRIVEELTEDSKYRLFTRTM